MGSLSTDVCVLSSGCGCERSDYIWASAVFGAARTISWSCFIVSILEEMEETLQDRVGGMSSEGRGYQNKHNIHARISAEIYRSLPSPIGASSETSGITEYGSVENR